MICFICYFILFFLIPLHETLRCYSCRGEKQCGILFSSNSTDVKIIDGNDLEDSCSITMNLNGSLIRNIIPSYLCGSTLYQFCCNYDLCNSLPSLPLPVFNNLKCMVDVCRINDSQCNKSIINLSSTTQSCIRKDGKTSYKSYQTGCSSNATKYNDVYCCNYPLCNEQDFHHSEAIRCYTCDSRLTGLKDCDILNITNPYVYNSVSSNPSESCAMIIGLAGKDLAIGQNYSAFTIRTFINNCTNQSLGNITYGGIRFQGQIECCSTSLCNTNPLYTNITLPSNISKHVNRIIRVSVFTLFVILGLSFAIIGIVLSIIRFRFNKSHRRYLPIVKTDRNTVIFLS
ncbi:hypothetical protein I4U23_020267 [Adineta vaga]|nr:hypothetical protein I4U23_020267 [Adineta vaga]